MNFTAAGTAIGSVKEFNSNLDIAFTISSGRNKFQSNEIFGDTNSSTIALIELQTNPGTPSIQFGLMKENDSQMGLSGSGALNGQGNQLTNFLGISNSMDILGGKFFGSFYWGLTADSEKEMGMISSINLKLFTFSTTLYSNGFSRTDIKDFPLNLLLVILA